MAKTKSLVLEKAYAFAIRIVRLYQYLVEEKKNGYWQNNFFGVEPQLVH